jgi:hypothetical protein
VECSGCRLRAYISKRSSLAHVKERLLARKASAEPLEFCLSSLCGRALAVMMRKVEQYSADQSNRSYEGRSHYDPSGHLHCCRSFQNV